MADYISDKYAKIVSPATLLNKVLRSVQLKYCFDLLLKNFNIGHNFYVLWDKAFIFGMCVPYDKTFPMVP